MEPKPKSSPVISIEDIMTRDVICVTPEMTVKEVIEMLVSHRISGAPVVDKFKKVISVVSEGDLLKLAAYEGIGKKIASCLNRLPQTEALLTLPRTATFKDAYKMFLTKSVHRIIIVDANGHIQGILSRSNVLRILTELLKSADSSDEQVSASSPSDDSKLAG